MKNIKLIEFLKRQKFSHVSVTNTLILSLLLIILDGPILVRPFISAPLSRSHIGLSIMARAIVA